MPAVMVDSNVLLDVLTEDSRWFEWSAGELEAAAELHPLILSPLVYAEVSVRFGRIEDLDEALPDSFFQREALPWEAAFLAGKVFLKYRRTGGTKRSPLPDFYIGAHAAVAGHILLTRDPRRYRRYFPRLELRAP